MVADIDKKKIWNVVRKSFIERRKKCLLKDDIRQFFFFKLSK